MRREKSENNEDAEALKQLRTERDGHIAEVNRLLSELSEKNDEIEKLDASLKPIETRLAEVLAENARLRTDCAATSANERTLEQSVTDLRDQLHQAEEKLSAAEDERDRLRQQLCDASTQGNAELKRLREDLQKAYADLDAEKEESSSAARSNEALQAEVR